MQAGLTIGRNRGGINTPTVGTTGQSNTNDLNDPNFTVTPEGIVGNDSQVAFRLSGSYTLPYEINLAGSLISNNGYPYQSTYSIYACLRGDAGRGPDPRDARSCRSASAATSASTR